MTDTSLDFPDKPEAQDYTLIQVSDEQMKIIADIQAVTSTLQINACSARIPVKTGWNIPLLKSLLGGIMMTS